MLLLGEDFLLRIRFQTKFLIGLHALCRTFFSSSFFSVRYDLIQLATSLINILSLGLKQLRIYFSLSLSLLFTFFMKTKEARDILFRVNISVRPMFQRFVPLHFHKLKTFCKKYWLRYQNWSDPYHIRSLCYLIRYGSDRSYIMKKKKKKKRSLRELSQGLWRRITS